VAAAQVLRGPAAPPRLGREDLLNGLPAALYASRICVYAQGFALISAASRTHEWQIDLAEVARIWKAGCIIRARLLDPLRHAFASTPGLANALVDPALAEAIDHAQAAWRQVVSAGGAAGIPLPAHATALAYFDSYRSAQLPQNLTQAQRDAFGAHTYERTDTPGKQHSGW
jgi:6-phosphogluconate dehydrogenase